MTSATDVFASVQDVSRDELFIDGAWRRPADGHLIDVVSPSTEETVAVAAVAGPADMLDAVAAARRAFDTGPWPRMSPEERSSVLTRMAAEVEARSGVLELVAGLEGGTTVAMARGFRSGAQSLLSHFANVGRSFSTSQTVEGLFSTAEVRLVPIGVCGVIVPWNAPLTISLFSVAPALAAGCTVVLKSPPETPLATYLLAEIAAAAGLPPGVLNVVCADRDVSEMLVTDRGVDKLSFTGSTAVGRHVASLSGARLVPTTLELGGKSAAIVLDDADPAEVAASLSPLTMLNSGQACTNVTRVLVPRARHDEFVDAMAAVISGFQVGDPFDPATFVGPVISAKQRERIEGYLGSAAQDGARALVGGGRPAYLDRGFFVEATLYDQVENHMTIAREEIFGPVVAVIDHDGDEQAVALANDSAYGLSGNVWSADVERATAVAHQVRTGNIGINGNFLDWAIPFGGMKQSGLGRELGIDGLRSFFETQSVHRSK